jgi:hypothetical protein
MGPTAGTTRGYLVDGEAWDPAPRFTPELREGVEFGSSRGNSEPVPKTSQEFGDRRRAKRGTRTRPPRPGQWA